MLRNPFTKPKPTSPPDPTYANMFEIMRYDRGMDVMPYAIAYRLKPPFLDPTGPEPSFALLDTEAEIDAFMDVLHSPIVFGPSGKPAWPPLQQWNETPSALMADTVLVSFAYPDDETQDWPFMQLFAVPPAMFGDGKSRPEDTVRGRYNFRQFPPEEKGRYVRELSDARAKAGGTDVFIRGKLPVSLVDLLNPRKPGSDQ